MSDDLNFASIALVEVPVTLGDKKYVLREASEAAALRFRGSQLQDAKLVDGKVSANISRVAESQALLVSLCLFDENGKPVPLATVLDMRARIVKRLFDKAKEISDLDEREGKEELEKRLADTQAKIKALGSGADPTRELRIASTDASD
jgi:hypothetical protein